VGDLFDGAYGGILWSLVFLYLTEVVMYNVEVVMKEVKWQGLSPRQKGAMRMTFNYSHALCERDGVFSGDRHYKGMLTQYGCGFVYVSHAKELLAAGLGPKYDVTFNSLVQRGLLKKQYGAFFLTKQGIALLEKYPLRVRK
jgi:hypothetical protein